MKALKYIQKYKHLYQAGTEKSGEFKELKKKFKLDGQMKTMKLFGHATLGRDDAVKNTYIKPQKK